MYFLFWLLFLFDDILFYVFFWDFCCCLVGWVCVCFEFCDCGWGCCICCGWDGGGIGCCGCNSGCWEVGVFVCDGVEFVVIVWEVVVGGVFEDFFFVLFYFLLLLGIKEIVGLLLEFLFFKDGRFVGGGIWWVVLIFLRFCSLWWVVFVI